MIFDLYWADVDSQESFLFEKDSSLEEFILDCNLALKRAGDKIIKQAVWGGNQKKAWITAADWVRLAAKELEEMGYFPIRPKRYGLSGYIIDDPLEVSVNYINDSSVETPTFSNIVGEELLKRVIAHNASIREEQDRERTEERRKRAIEGANNKS